MRERRPLCSRQRKKIYLPKIIKKTLVESPLPYKKKNSEYVPVWTWDVTLIKGVLSFRMGRWSPLPPITRHQANPGHFWAKKNFTPPSFRIFWICNSVSTHCQRMIDGLLQGSPSYVSPLTDLGLIYQRPWINRVTVDINITLCYTPTVSSYIWGGWKFNVFAVWSGIPSIVSFNSIFFSYAFFSYIYRQNTAKKWPLCINFALGPCLECFKQGCKANCLCLVYNAYR